VSTASTPDPRNPVLYGRVINWDDIPEETVRPGVRRKVYATDEVMIAWHSLDVGMDVNPHSHADFDQLVYIAEGLCDYHVAGTPHRMGPGSLMLVPAGAEHHIVPIEGPCINLDVFVPPRADFASSLGYLASLAPQA
jgi:quercetin dioxygenase-like cupin family protein